MLYFFMKMKNVGASDCSVTPTFIIEPFLLLIRESNQRKRGYRGRACPLIRAYMNMRITASEMTGRKDEGYKTFNSSSLKFQMKFSMVSLLV